MGDGWTAIPNDLLDNMADLGNAELRVLLVLIRKTAGYQKERDRVSVSQVAELTGLTSRNAQVALVSLLDGGFIGREQVGKQAYEYFVKPYPVGTRIKEPTNHIPSEPMSLGDTEPYPVGTRFDQKPYPLGITQKKELKKKEMIAPAAADAAPSPRPRVRKPKAAAKPPSDHQRLMSGYADLLGYTLPNGAKEAAGAKRLLDAGYSVDDVLSVYAEMKGDTFWAKKHLSLHNVFQQIGAILNERQSRAKAAAVRNPVVSAAAEPYNYDAEPSPYAAREARRAARQNGSLT